MPRKIDYTVTEEYDGEDNNIILYISEISEKTSDGDLEHDVEKFF